MGQAGEQAPVTVVIKGFGHQPPCVVPCCMVKSSEAQSAPVWSPETIFWILVILLSHWSAV